MQIKPNQTILEGKVTSIRPHHEGWGADVDLEVLRNVSPSAEEDFLNPRPGQTITTFTAEPGKLVVGNLVRAQATLLGGPHGERAVLQEVEPLS